MLTFRLPSHLLQQKELLELNKQLHAGAVRLDWSDVAVDVDPGRVAVLLRGLNLADHVELIGSDTIGDALLPTVLSVFGSDDVDGDDEEATLATKAVLYTVPKSASKPKLWTPSSEQMPSGVQATTGEQMPSGGQVRINEDRDLPEMKRATVKSATTTVTKSATATVLRAPSQAAMRDELEQLVVHDLLGPAGGAEEEVDEFRVHDRYLVGILAPLDAPEPAEELDSQGVLEEGTEDSGMPDTDASQTNSLSPSSMGLTFCVSAETTHLHVTPSWGEYRRIDSEVKADGRNLKIWKRMPRGGKPYVLSLRAGLIERYVPEPEEQPEVYMRGVIRRSPEGWTITLFLVNGQKVRARRNTDRYYLFQAAISVEAPDGGAVFRRRPAEVQRAYKEEDKALAMLYRKHVGFAIGHGVSVHADTLEDNPACAYRIMTRFIPAYEVARTEAPTAEDIPELQALCLDMQTLAQLEMSELAERLAPLVDSYRVWINDLAKRLKDPKEELQGYEQAAKRAIRHCRETLDRIHDGIELISSDVEAYRAFAFMNKAMHQQRVHTLHAEAKRQDPSADIEAIDVPKNRTWRPFQLAFILLNIPALTDLGHDDRSTAKEAIADLLWFPTGGGKTEAYLGLTAYTLGMRRLQGVVEGRSGEHGVAVIMRYTLRLLTLQQFQRAAALICACEVIRREEPTRWGENPFRLGLWVGQKSTPNKTEESEKAVAQVRGASAGYTGGLGNPRQLTHCPWCGSGIETGRDITVETYERGRGRTLIYCSDKYGACAFSRKKNLDGLPVLVVDEEIYRLLPALLISTVDKFAQLPWRGETEMLFGQVNKYCPRHGFRSPDLKDSDSHPKKDAYAKVTSVEHAPLRPPDLIIQDELHLISGPLGTMVGLYETAIDQLATWEVKGKAVRPKVIAATATIRQADMQIQALFMRTAKIFPPQGLDVGDNFFSRQRKAGPEQPGRRYLGICANGRRMKATQIRVYLAYLAGAQLLFEKYGAAADPWMTLVGYFNSMRELGSMRHLVDDDIGNRIWRMEKRGLAKRGRPKVKELTSRISSDDIPDILSQLEQPYQREMYPIDVLLATNMISVGVDVKRLGLMVVTGQPKTTSEYIQATSRVGRNAPGLVCTIYNWARPRDISHYEQFEHYHATFYQHVEALSITPFAPRALDRGLAALLVSMIRHWGSTYNRNDTAGEIYENAHLLDEVIQLITDRASEIAIDTSDIVRNDLEKLRDYWLTLAGKHQILNYDQQRNGATKLLSPPSRGKWQPFTCLNSMRNVEPMVQLLLDEQILGKSSVTFSEEEIQEESN